MKRTCIAGAALVALCGGASAAEVTLYGRIGVAVAQEADAPETKQVRNDMGSRLGFKGSEDLGGGLKAIFDLQHRFNADDGTAGSRFWEGKSIVGIEGGFGRISLGREESPAYALSREPADPWGTYTVASNGSLINGRIASSRVSNSINYGLKLGDFRFGAQYADRQGNVPVDADGNEIVANTDRPWAVAAAWKSGPIHVAVGYENPANENDSWANLLASYDFGVVRVGGFYGTGRNTADQKHQAWMLTAVAPIGPGEVRASYGQLKNKDTGIKRDKQWALGYVYKLSKRTSVYATLAREDRDNMPDANEKTGYDLGLRHDF